MKTLADIKRRAQLGVRIVMTYHWMPAPAGRPTLVGVPRAVTKVQGNAIRFAPVDPSRPNSDGSWLTWPKASEVRIDGPDSFSVLDEKGETNMSYAFVREEGDFRIFNEGSIMLVRPLTPAAREWLDANVGDRDIVQWFGGALVVEPRYIHSLVIGMEDAGLVRG